MNKTEFKSSIVIDEGAQNLIIELLKNYEHYEQLPDHLRSLINEYSFDRLKYILRTNEYIKPRYSKLFVLVDYINAFVDGSLGSSYAKDIEMSVLNDLELAMADPETAVVVLIDGHRNNETYFTTREGKHLPVLHANTAEERMIYGKVGVALSGWYNADEEEYVSDPENSIWFIEKDQFGCSTITDGVTDGVDDAIDKLLDLCSDYDLDNAAKYMGKEFNWNHVYDTVTNLANVEFSPNEIRLAGVATNICVLSNAIVLQTQYPQVEIYIRESSVASYDPDLHAKAIDIMKGLGMNID